MKWEDATSYSRGSERVPKAWQTKPCDDLRIVVTCGHIYHPGEWVMHCQPWFSTYPLGGVKTAEEAQERALELVTKKVAAMAAALSA
jgi:hypothetical protein